jgi:spore coat protein U-like protein
MKHVKLNKFTMTVAALLVSGAACADTSGTGTLGVSAVIAPECAVAQDVAIDFSTLSMLDSANAAPSAADSVHSGSMKAICTNGTPSPQFSYDSTNGSGATFRLVGLDATTFIPYSLFQGTDETGTAVVYNTPMSYAGFVANGATQVLPMAAKIAFADKQGKANQTYSDTINITTSFVP